MDKILFISNLEGDLPIPSKLKYFILSSLLNIYYLLQPVFIAFNKKNIKNINITKAPLTIWPPVITGVGCLFLFFFSNYFLNIINGVVA